MTKVDLITGFLGAGKTTFLKGCADFLNRRGISYAIVENEFGKSGIDSAILKQEGTHVTELTGGCICCGLKVGFYTLLQELAESGKYDRILVEPSGIFNLDDYFDVVGSLAERKILEIGTIATILDPECVVSSDPLIREMLFSHLHSTGTVLISKLSDSGETHKPDYAEAVDGIFDDFGLTRSEEQPVIAMPWEKLTDRDYEELFRRPPVCLNHERKVYDHTALFRSAAFVPKRGYGIAELEEMLKAVFGRKYGSVLRAKGYVRGENGAVLEVNCTADSISIREASDVPVGLNLIGQNINRAGVKELFQM